MKIVTWNVNSITNAYPERMCGAWVHCFISSAKTWLLGTIMAAFASAACAGSHDTEDSAASQLESRKDLLSNCNERFLGKPGCNYASPKLANAKLRVSDDIGRIASISFNDRGESMLQLFVACKDKLADADDKELKPANGVCAETLDGIRNFPVYIFESSAQAGAQSFEGKLGLYVMSQDTGGKDRQYLLKKESAKLSLRETTDPKKGKESALELKTAPPANNR